MDLGISPLNLLCCKARTVSFFNDPIFGGIFPLNLLQQICKTAQNKQTNKDRIFSGLSPAKLVSNEQRTKQTLQIRHVSDLFRDVSGEAVNIEVKISKFS